MKDCGLAFMFNSRNFKFPGSLSTLSAVNNFFENYDFVMIIMGNLSTTEKLLKDNFMLISLIFLRITSMKQFTKFTSELSKNF